DRDWLFEGLSHHIDTTHLASTIRISRILDDQPGLQLAVQLAEYGQKLHEDFHYSGELPFVAIYDDSLVFLRALIGESVDEAVAWLQQILSEHPDNRDGAAWYVYLLDRLGRGGEATRAWLEWLHEGEQEAMLTTDVAPALMTLVSKYGEFEFVKSTLLERGDLLGYATVASIETQRENNPAQSGT
ncbi:MAG: hypothetical protein ACR2NP_00260, partial [Pirellulaceae bacterium]